VQRDSGKTYQFTVAMLSVRVASSMNNGLYSKVGLINDGVNWTQPA
jgi:hypothetical protein